MEPNVMSVMPPKPLTPGLLLVEPMHIAEAMPAIVWIAGADGLPTYYNALWYDFTGLSRDSTKEEHHAAVHPEDQGVLYAIWIESLKTGTLFEKEYRLRRADGVYVWHVARCIPFRDATGAVTSWIGTAANIDRQKSTEHKLTKIISSMTSGNYSMDRNGRITEINEVAAQHLNISPQHAIGMLIWDLVPALATNSFGERMRQMMSHKSAHEEVVEYYSDRMGRWYEIHLFSSAEGLSLYYNDISERKQTLDNEERLRLALAAGQAGIWDWDIHKDKLTWSEQVYEFHGIDPNQFGGNLQAFMKLVYPEDRSRVRDAIEVAIKNRQSYQIEFRVVHPSGEIHWVTTTGNTIFDNKGRPIRMLGATTDVTERKQFEEKLKHAKEAADEANEAKTRFLANMSHEIRTPLGAVLGFADMLENPDLSHEERRETVGIIKRNGKLLQMLVDEILDLSKIEAERLDIETISFSLNQFLQDIVALMQRSAQERGIRFVCDESALDSSWGLIGDPFRLKQILLNLIGNAIKFTESGYVKLKTSVEKLTANTVKVHFYVVDTGIGIDPKHQKNLFEPFRQADSSMTRRFGGTGLGLALSRRLARLLGGDLTLENSIPCSGTTFHATITAQVASEKNSKPATAPIPVKTNSTSSPLAGLNILVIDDAIDNRTLVSYILKAAGAKVDTAENGKEGVRKALATPFSVVLLDIQMPIMDGFEAMTTLRSAGYSRPIVALTAHALQSEKNRSLDAGFDAYLTKPIDRHRLIELILKLAVS